MARTRNRRFGRPKDWWEGELRRSLALASLRLGLSVICCHCMIDVALRCFGWDGLVVASAGVHHCCVAYCSLAYHRAFPLAAVANLVCRTPSWGCVLGSFVCSSIEAEGLDVDPSAAMRGSSCCRAAIAVRGLRRAGRAPPPGRVCCAAERGAEDVLVGTQLLLDTPTQKRISRRHFPLP